MNANRAGLNISEPVWTHERVGSSRSIPQALESLAVLSRYQRDEEIYPQQGGVECWYRVVRGAKAVLRLRRAAANRRSLTPRRFLRVRGPRRACLRGRAMVADTVIARYPASRIETLATSSPRAAGLTWDRHDAISRLHSLLLIPAEPQRSKGRIVPAAHARTRGRWRR